MLKSIQAGRGVAALVVLLFHLGGSFGSDVYFGSDPSHGAFAWGNAGVEFFFVLSGFIIFYAHGRDLSCAKALRGYMLKRFVRVFPVYWLILAVVALAAFILKGPTVTQGVTVTDAVRTIALLPQPTTEGRFGAPLLIVAWSLQYEMLFYAVGAIGIVSKRLMFGVATAWLAAICVQLLAAPGGDSPFLATYPVGFFLGALACLAYRRGSVSRFVGWRFVLAVGFVAVVILIAMDLHGALTGDEGLRTIYYSLAFALLLLGLVEAERAGCVVGRGEPWQLLGAASYVLYLLHFPLISFFNKMILAAGGVSRSLWLSAAYWGVMASCVVGAVVFHLYVELPLVSLVRRRVGLGGRPEAR